MNNNISNKEAAVHVQKRGNGLTSFTVVFLIPSLNTVCTQTPSDLCMLSCGYQFLYLVISWFHYGATEHAQNLFPCNKTQMMCWALASGGSRWKWLHPLLVEASPEDSCTANSLPYNPEGKRASASARVTVDHLQTTLGTAKGSAVYGPTHRWLISVVGP